VTALLYHLGDNDLDATPVEIDRATPTLTLDGRRYVLEAWANPALWPGVLYREVRP